MIFSINPEVSDISGEDMKLYDRQKNLFPVSRYIRLSNLISKALEEMKWHDQPRILLELYLLKMAEPYYNVAELIAKLNELGKQQLSNAQVTCESLEINSNQHSNATENIVENVQIPNMKGHESTEENTIITMADSFDNDLMGLWKDIVTEFSRKHPMSAQSLKDATVKELNANTFQISVSTQLALNMIKMHQETIRKLMTRKSGRDITVSMVLTDIAQNGGVVKEDIKIEPEHDTAPTEQFAVVEDFKETAKTAIPSKIESFAKKFGGSVIKKEKDSSINENNINKTEEFSENESEE